MRIVVLPVCICYWLFLTVLLLVPNPAALVGLHAAPSLPWGKFGIHLTAFTILGFLGNATRWPKGLGWPMIVGLMGYGITTEALQLFVPHRTSRVMDGMENLLGIAAGSAIYWLVLRLMQSSRKAKLAANLDEALGGAPCSCGCCASRRAKMQCARTAAIRPLRVRQRNADSARRNRRTDCRISSD